jgi:diguanylate cyclase (GGDEF)-like protein
MERTLPRSKVARRLVLMFLGGALVPLAALSLLAFGQVSDELYRQSQRRLHHASKATALSVLDRMLELEAALVEIEERLAGEERPQAAPLPTADERFDAFTLFSPEGRPLAASQEIALPYLSPGQRAHLASGKTLLTTLRGSDGNSRVLLSRQLRMGPTPGRLLVASANLERLLRVSPEDTLPPRAEYCILDESRRILRCSFGDDLAMPAEALASMRAGVSGEFQWSRLDEEYLARFWSLFLGPNFHAQTWTFVLAESRENVLAPIADFQRTVPPVILTCFLVVTLVSLRQIRQQLGPLEKLQEGTKLVAAGRFDVAVDVKSGDEFEDLADSFNLMAARLGEHFDALAALVDIDRSILSALDPESIAEAVLARFRELHPCDQLALLLRAHEPPAELRAFLSADPGAPPRILDLPALSDAELRLLACQPESAHLEPGGDSGGFLAWLWPLGARRALVLPLAVRGAVAGAIVCGHRDGAAPGREQLTFARQMADQVALALSNANTIEENRVLAYHDRLTGLPNRLMFQERAALALHEAARHRNRVAICLIDLDGFKRVNDSLGHDAGDALLKQVAERVGRMTRGGGFMRMGGDEFAILLNHLDSVEESARAAQRAIDAIVQPYDVDGQEIFVSASIGIAVHPEDGNELPTLLRNADTAMYHAKAAGGNQYRFYTHAMHASASNRLNLEGRIRRGLERGEFRVFYQPLVDVRSREIVGAEALLRWQDPERGLLPPNDFVPVAEESGLIVPLGEWVLRRVCRQQRAWLDQGLALPRVSVNLSGRQVTSGTLIQSVQRALLEATLFPHHLVLELTESTLMDPTEGVQACLEELRALGVRLSIDDFGTGYSSLAYLKHFPLDHLKIDRSFVCDVANDRDDAAIVGAVIGMAHSLELGVVAEGVETEAQLAFLRELGCETAQGHLFAEALPPDAFEKLLREQT